MLLREQLKTINKELGEDDAAKGDIAELAAAIDEGEAAGGSARARARRS